MWGLFDNWVITKSRTSACEKKAYRCMSNRNEFYMQITMQNSAKLCMQCTPYKKISEIAYMIKNKKKTSLDLEN